MDNTIETISDEQVKCWLCGGAAAVDDLYRSVALYRCADCGFLFAPERDTDELHEIYSDEYFEQYPGGKSYDEDEPQRRFEAERRRDWVLKKIEGGRLLEIGAAAGMFLDVMRDSDFEVFGVEPAEGLAAYARDKRGIDVRAGFVESVELPDQKVDVVCAWHVLEHIRQPLASMQRLRSVINDDGWMFLEIPNIRSAMARRAGVNWFHLDPEHHVAFYEPAQLERLLNDSGFELVETFSVSAFSYLRPGIAWAPKSIAARLRETAITRSLPSRPSPDSHELLRVVARPA